MQQATEQVRVKMPAEAVERDRNIVTRNEETGLDQLPRYRAHFWLGRIYEHQRRDGETGGAQRLAVDEVALTVDGQAAVGVTVEREAGVRAVLEHRLLQHAEVR